MPAPFFILISCSFYGQYCYLISPDIFPASQVKYSDNWHRQYIVLQLHQPLLPAHTPLIKIFSDSCSSNSQVHLYTVPGHPIYPLPHLPLNYTGFFYSSHIFNNIFVNFLQYLFYFKLLFFSSAFYKKGKFCFKKINSSQKEIVFLRRIIYAGDIYVK